MASDSDNKSGPRVRVRIPGMGGQPPPVAAGGSAATPNGLSGSALPTAADDDRIRRLTFELEVGELPNVLQFLSTDKRTGKLELTVRNQPNAGYVFFTNGAIYLARYRQYDGVEALARVVNAGRIRAVFVNGAQAGEQNVDVPVSSLLLEVLVRADELAASGEPPEPPPAQFRVAPAGKAVPQMAESSADTAAPAANSVSASRNLPALELADDAEFALAGPGQFVRIKPAGTPLPELVAANGGMPAPPAPVAETPAPPRRRRFARRLAAILLEILVVASLVVGGMWGYRRYVQPAEPSQKPVPEQVNGINLTGRTGELDAALVASWLREAEQAADTRQYATADQLLGQILTADPHNLTALALRARIDHEDAPALAKRLHAVAKFKISEVATLENFDWARAETARATTLMEAGVKLMEAAQHEGAVKTFRALTNLVDQLMARRQVYLTAVEKQRLLRTFKERAQAVAGVRNAPGLWQEASLAEQSGADLFADGHFIDAGNAWQQASVLFQRTAAYAEEVLETIRLASEYQTLRQACEAAKSPPDEAILAINRAATFAAQAVQLSESGNAVHAKEQWVLATRQLKQAMAAIDQAGERSGFIAALESAQAALAAGRWQEAKAGFAAAQAIPGFALDPAALKGVMQAEKGLLGANLQAAARDGRWAEAKAAAEEMLRLDANHAEAIDIVARARQHLVVKLTVEAIHDGQSVPGARAIIGSDGETRTLPCIVNLEAEANYHVRVWAPPVGSVFFDTFSSVYEAGKPGEATLTVTLKAASGPEKARPWRLPGLNLDMAYIRPGSFDRGSQRHSDESPVHRVNISRHFWMGSTEITNQHYQSFLDESGYDGSKAANTGYLRHFDGSSAMSAERNHPVCYVSWKNAMAFCEWLTVRERAGQRLPDGYVYRLPTEAEWEYCATVGGTARIFDLDAMAWHAKNSKANQPVQQLQANAWGLFDLLGNVWELCYDFYGRYRPEEVTDPTGPNAGVLRVMRGGSHANPADLCRPTYRSSIGWTDCRPNVGFRIVLAPAIAELGKATGNNR